MNNFVFQWFMFRTNRNLSYIDPILQSFHVCIVRIGIGNADINMDKCTFLKIYFPNGSFHGIRYTPSTTVAV
jgi:hypothetical protein